jgi:WD40 repeat protein
MAKVFVSYSRKDSIVARKLIDGLSSIEQDVWVDWEDIPPAVDWLEQILRGIEGSDAFIFLISPDSVASEVCNVEVKHAALNNRRIIPIVLRDVDPKTTIEIIRKLNWTFLREQDNFDEGLAKVKVAIELDLPWVEEHNRLQARALDWHRKKEPSLLLRGRDLRNARNMIATATSKDPTPTELQKTYIQHSIRSERNRMVAGIATGIAVIALAILSYRAIQASNEAQRQEKIAVTNAEAARQAQLVAEDQRGKAERARDDAEEQRKIADEQRNIAEAQRSAARAQIFQNEPGGLYKSTLLAIDSWQKSPSPEAEEILRRNISLLPLPVAQASQSGKINSVEFSPDGHTFVTTSADGMTCVWNVKAGTMLFCADSSGSVNDAVFGPNGRFIVTGDDSGIVQMLDADSGIIQKEFEYDDPVRDLSISSDGKLLAVARADGKITIINLSTGKKNSDLQITGKLNVSAFSPDGVWLAAGSNTGIVTLWNLNNGETRSRPRHKGEVLAIEFSPNNRLIVSGGKDKTAYVTDIATGEELLRVSNEDAVEDVAFGPDSSWFVTVSDDQRIRVWDMLSGRERLRMLQDSLVTEVKVSSNGQWIATTGSDETVRVWNAATGAEIFQIPLQASGSVLAFNRDGNYLLSGDESGAINIWDISVMPAPENYIQFNNGIAGNVKYSPSDDWIVASDENRVWLQNPEQLSDLTARPEGEPILEFKSNVKDILFSPDSKLLGIVTEGNEVATYEIENLSLKTLKVSSPIQSIAFSPDSLQFVTGDAEGKVQAWQVNNTEFIENLRDGNSKVFSMAASSQLLAVGLTDKIIIVDMNSGQTLPEIESPGDHQLVAFGADGSLLASSNSSDQINIWKYQNGASTRVAPTIQEQIFSLAFNPTGKLLAVGAASNVYLIDTSTGEEVARIPHADNVNGVSFSADGNILATASSKVIQFWDVTKIQLQRIKKGDLIRIACSRLPKNFSDAQWSSLLTLCGNLPMP